MRASVVSGSDAPPVLDAGEHVFDFVALLVGGFVEGDVGLAAGPGWDAGFDAAHGEEPSEPVGIIAFVCNQDFGVRQVWGDDRGTVEIADLAFGQQQDQGPPERVTNRVELGVQAAFGAPDTAG